VDAQGLRPREAQTHLLEVEHDVAHVLEHPGDGRELVQHPADPHRGDGCTLERRQQHAPQRIAQCLAEAALERLAPESTIAAVGLLLAHLEAARTDQLTPVLRDDFLLHAVPPGGVD
jgi:hypothetical protein